MVAHSKQVLYTHVHVHTLTTAGGLPRTDIGSSPLNDRALTLGFKPLFTTT